MSYYNAVIMCFDPIFKRICHKPVQTYKEVKMDKLIIDGKEIPLSKETVTSLKTTLSLKRVLNHSEFFLEKRDDSIILRYGVWNILKINLNKGTFQRVGCVGEGKFCLDSQNKITEAT